MLSGCNAGNGEIVKASSYTDLTIHHGTFQDLSIL